MLLTPKRALLLFTLCCSVGLTAITHAAERTIAVTGTGQIEVWPDYLSLQLFVSADAPTSAAAKQKVDIAANDVFAIAKKLDIAATDIDAAQLTNQPVYDWHEGKSTKRAEQVSRAITLRLRNLEHHTALVHGLVQLENVQLQHTSMEFNDPDALSLQASTLALKQAQHKATTMAAALDSRLGKVLSIEEPGAAPMYSMRMTTMANAESATAAPMLVQKQTISSSVNVRFELK